jgi:hypothetical protein
MADMAVRERIPMVLSMKGWGVAERARFVTDFAKQLLKSNAEPLMVVLEEADAFVPQRPAKGEEAMLGEMDRMVRWGRGSGIGCTLITQRSAKVNKDVTTQAETLIAFRTTGPQDRDAIDNWIKFHAGQDRRDDVLSSLPTLPDGTAWVWSPEWLDVFDKYAFRRRTTYDSGATPKVGEKRPKPKELATVDLERLRGQMAATIEKAKADDPRELRRQLAEANKRIADAQKGITRSNTRAVKPPKVVEKFVLKDGQLARAEALVERIELLSDKFSGYEEDLRITAKEIRDALAKTRQPIAGPPPPPRTPGPVTPPRPPRDRAVDVDTSDLPPGERAVLTAALQYPGLERTRLSILTGYKRSSRDAYIVRLASKGLIEVRGSTVVPTPAGRAALNGSFEPLPSGADLVAYWKQRLPEGERRVLETLLLYGEQDVDRERIDAATGYKRSSRDAYLVRLKARGLVDFSGRGTVRASGELFA